MFFNDAPEGFFPGTQIEVVRFPEGVAGGNLDEKIFQGPLHQQLRDAFAYLKNRVIEERVVKLPDRAEAKRFFNYPFSALEEALVNAVYHRSYEQREPIEVRVNPGRDRDRELSRSSTRRSSIKALQVGSDHRTTLPEPPDWRLPQGTWTSPKADALASRRCGRRCARTARPRPEIRDGRRSGRTSWSNCRSTPTSTPNMGLAGTHDRGPMKGSEKGSKRDGPTKGLSTSRRPSERILRALKDGARRARPTSQATLAIRRSTGAVKQLPSGTRLEDSGPGRLDDPRDAPAASNQKRQLTIQGHKTQCEGG